MRPAYLLLLPLLASSQPAPVRSVNDPGVVTTRQSITPAGIPTVFTGRVYGVTFGAEPSEVWVLNASQLFRLDWKSNKVLGEVTLGGSPGLQSVRFDATAGNAIWAEASRGAGVQLVAAEGNKRRVIGADLGKTLSGGFAIASKPDTLSRRLAVVPLTAENRLAVIDIERSAVLGRVAVGIAPFGAAVASDGSVAYVTNWGGRLPVTGDPTAPTGASPEADRVVIDGRGIASTGTVTRVDMTKMAVTDTIPVELHPTAIAWDEPRNRLYVANSNSDSVSVIDTSSQRVTRTIPVQPFERKVNGIAPTALAVSADGKRLFIACGGINAVAVVATDSGRLEGLIPTAWYPNSVALSSDGTKLAVTALLGAGSGWREEPKKRFVHAYRGSVSVLDVPTAEQLAGYTAAVAANTHMKVAGAQPVAEPAPSAVAKAIPLRSGDPSPIEHVVFIVKENRTYDQVFGALGKGNGDPSLTMFGRDITPNQHKLAEQFVTLDNFYATGGNSADGHQWLTQANETAYCMWPGYAGRSYPYDGSDPIAYASGGFLWDYVLARRKTVRVYGEFVPALRTRPDRHALLERWRKGDRNFTGEWKVSSPIPRLDANLMREYPSYNLGVPDVVRASIFFEDFRRMEKEGKMPNLVMIQLPSDHTEGARAGSSTPQAMVADNDLALGQIVEALSASRFWPKMAIFVTEDDAQNGVDHVDGHRTVTLVASPYARRGAIDSTFYSSQSILKTIELILGLPTMSLFDLIAQEMRNSFTDTPDLTPFKAETPKQSLYDRNPQVQALRGPARQAALASARMKFGTPDAAPTEKLNRIVWGMIRGWDAKYPEPRNAVFAPLSLDIDDDDR